MNKPWLEMNINNYDGQWWKYCDLIDKNNYPSENDVLCYFIIQDGSMFGNIWYISTWYLNCPNRYADIIYDKSWLFNKRLHEMNEGDIVYLKKNPEFKFKVYNSLTALEQQKQFCKILERVK
jgi:hypothetical protein